jgi:hypothetical protein
MLATDRLRLLGEVLEVRRTQKVAAQMGLARAQEALAELLHRREAQQALAVELQDGWSRSIGGASVELQAARGWMEAITQAETRSLALDLEIRQARSDQEQARADLMAAIGRMDASESLVRSARRRWSHRREEAALAEIDDRSARRSARR